jgi:hypothetical protein
LQLNDHYGKETRGRRPAIVPSVICRDRWHNTKMRQASKIVVGIWLPSA